VSFTGSFNYSIDERGRVPIPPPWREAFQDGIVLSQGSPDRCIRVQTPAEFDATIRKIRSAPPLSSVGRDLRRMLVSTVHETQLDAQSRVLIPSWLREYARIETKVRVIGMVESIEIWAPEALDADLDRIAAVVAAELDSLDERRG
jgi:MraZ protein